MKAEPLPYDMGNSGDLIKHGMIAEFAQWWCLYNQKPFIFYDPFGGRPWASPPNKKVMGRLMQLQNCALLNAQPDLYNFYYGSGHVIKNVANHAGCIAKVFVSDRDEDAVKDMLDSGLKPIERHKFVKEDAYSILNSGLTSKDATLLLIDPFSDFLESSDRLLPEVVNFVFTAKVPVTLFLLHDQKMSGDYEDFQDRRRKEYGKGMVQFSYSCPQLQNTSIKGEEKYISETILFLPANNRTGRLDLLRNALKKYSNMLTEVLCEKVNFEEVS